MLGHLVVPDATLDNELEPQNDADVLQNVYLGMELLNLQMHVWDKYINIKYTLQSASEGVVAWQMLKPPLASGYKNVYSNIVLVGPVHLVLRNNSSQ